VAHHHDRVLPACRSWSWHGDLAGAYAAGPTPRPPTHRTTGSDYQPSCGPCPGPRRTKTDRTAGGRRLTGTGRRGGTRTVPRQHHNTAGGPRDLGVAHRTGDGSGPCDRPEAGRSGEAACGDLHRPLTSAPGRIRARDPLLRRHIRTVAGRRLVSPYVAASCMKRPSASPCVARRLPPMAPRLAPQNLVN
jgi:hypothetical protein